MFSHRQVCVCADDALYCFVWFGICIDGVYVTFAAAMMSSIYDEHKDEDGFLYFTYSGENTFGDVITC